MTPWVLAHEAAGMKPTSCITAPGITGASLLLPVLCFPSGVTLPLLACAADEARDVALLGDLGIPVYATRNRALTEIHHDADVCGYLVQKKGGNRIQIWRGGETALLTFDNDQPRLVDVKIEKVESK